MAPPLRLTGISKNFGSAVVLRDVSLDIRPGSFIGLLGPNGAGKSTLIKILAGLESASAGRIELGGKLVASLAGRPDVGFLHQDMGLVAAMSIGDNLRLGIGPLRNRLGLIDKAAERASARRALARVGLDADPQAAVGTLSAGGQALVAVARLLDLGARILVVDEATSTLAPADASVLAESLRQLAADGATVLMVTHKMNEVLDFTDRVVTLIDGRIAADRMTADLTFAKLLEILGSEAAGADAEAGPARSSGEVVVRLERACGGSAGPVDLELRRGEVMGLTGRPGSGLHDIALMAHRGIALTHGKAVRAKGARTAIVPPHRESQGGLSGQSVLANLSLTSLRRYRAPWGLVSDRRERAAGERMIARVSVQPPDPDADFGVLSGGNKQKVIFGRGLLAEPDLFILCEPTRGVDVGTRRELYRLIKQVADSGVAVLITSSDVEDLLAVSDVVGIVTNGVVGRLRARSEVGLDDLKEVL